VKSDEIARGVSTDPVVIRRILQRLGRAKLVEGAPGKTGGTRLARPPARITLLDIYQAMEEKGSVPQTSLKTKNKGEK